MVCFARRPTECDHLGLPTEPTTPERVTSPTTSRRPASSNSAAVGGNPRRTRAQVAAATGEIGMTANTPSPSRKNTTPPDAHRPCISQHHAAPEAFSVRSIHRPRWPSPRSRRLRDTREMGLEEPSAPPGRNPARHLRLQRGLGSLEGHGAVSDDGARRGRPALATIARNGVGRAMSGRYCPCPRNGSTRFGSGFFAFRRASIRTNAPSVSGAITSKPSRPSFEQNLLTSSK